MATRSNESLLFHVIINHHIVWPKGCSISLLVEQEVKIVKFQKRNTIVSVGNSNFGIPTLKR